MSREERDILENAIREGDFETIREHLGVPVDGAEEAIQFLNSLIGHFNRYAEMYRMGSVEIRAYLDRIRNEDPMIKEAKAVLGIDDITSYETILPPENSCDFPTVTKFYNSSGILVGQLEVGGYIGAEIWYRVGPGGELIVVKIGDVRVESGPLDLLSATGQAEEDTVAEVEKPEAPTVKGDSTVDEKIEVLQAAHTNLPEGIGLTGEMAQDRLFRDPSKLT
jgi:hypothetical protein